MHMIGPVTAAFPSTPVLYLQSESVDALTAGCRSVQSGPNSYPINHGELFEDACTRSLAAAREVAANAVDRSGVGAVVTATSADSATLKSILEAVFTRKVTGSSESLAAVPEQSVRAIALFLTDQAPFTIVHVCGSSRFRLHSAIPEYLFWGLRYFL